MLGKKKSLEDARADALGAFVDHFFIYDGDRGIYRFSSTSREVVATYMEDLLEFIAVNGYEPSLTELSDA